MKIHRYLHPPTRARNRREPGHPGGRAALVQLAPGSRISAHRKRRRHHIDQLPGRRSGGDRGIRHDPHRGGGGAGERHRLHDFDESKQHQHHHRVPAAELRYVEGGGRNQHQGKFRSQSAALRHAAADHRCESRADHRCDVHRFHQPDARLERDHRLPDSRRAAALAGRRGGTDGGNPRRSDFLVARLARSEEARGLWDDGERCGGGVGEQRLRIRPSATPRVR